MSIPILLDTDISDDIDDAYALALILASPEFELRGVTTVFRNAPARSRQARSLLQLAGRGDIPVAAGCSAVLSPELSWRWSTLSKEVEGRMIPLVSAQALQGWNPCQSSAALTEEQLQPLHPQHGVDFMIDTLMDGKTIPILIGAFTNLAMALTKEPRLLTRIPKIVVMGGCFDSSRTPNGWFKEWNIICDPIAAALVFNSGIPMQVAPLDVTQRCQFQARHLERLYASDRPVAQSLAAATRLWAAKDETEDTWRRGLPVLHDPLAVEMLIAPQVVTTRKGKVTVEIGGRHTFGQTVLDVQGPPIHEVAIDLDADAAIAFFLDRVLGQ